MTNAQNNNTRESLSLPDFPLVEAFTTWRIIVRNNTPTYSIDLLDYRKSTIAGSPAIGTTHDSLAGRSALNSHPDSAIALADAGSYTKILSTATNQNDVNDKIDDLLKLTPVSFTSTPQTLTSAHENRIIFWNDATVGGVLNLPAAATFSRIKVINIHGSGTVVLTPNGAETINGAASFTLTLQYEGYDIISDGTNLYLL